MSEQSVPRRRIKTLVLAVLFGLFAALTAIDRSGYGAPSPQPCARYTDNAAIQACKAGDMWAADRLQQKRSHGSERDWYNR